MSLFDEAFLIVMGEEGVKINVNTGEVIDSGTCVDSGGKTKFGLSEKALGKDPSDITLQEAKTIYERDYWLATGCEKVSELSKALAIMLFDTCVNQGPDTGPRLLQRILGVNPDGIIGPNTLRGITIDKEALLLHQFALARMERYAHIVLVRADENKYLAGWIIRVLNIVRYAKKYL